MERVFFFENMRGGEHPLRTVLREQCAQKMPGCGTDRFKFLLWPERLQFDNYDFDRLREFKNLKRDFYRPFFKFELLKMKA